MKIISSFHDYYDGLQAHGQGGGVVYVRKRLELGEVARRAYPEPPDAQLGGWRTPGPKYEEWRGRRCEVAGWPFWLAVAGKVYRGYQLRRRAVGEEDSNFFAYSAEDVARCSTAWGVETLRMDPGRSRRKYRWRYPVFSGLDWLSRQGTAELTEGPSPPRVSRLPAPSWAGAAETRKSPSSSTPAWQTSSSTASWGPPRSTRSWRFGSAASCPSAAPSPRRCPTPTASRSTASTSRRASGGARAVRVERPA